MKKTEYDADTLEADRLWHELVDELGLAPGLLAQPAPSTSEADGWSPWKLALIVPTVMALLAACVIGLRQALLLLGAALPGFLGDRPFGFYVSVAHVLLIGFMLVLQAGSVRPEPPQGSVARSAWRQFRRGWTLLWLSWLALYAWLSVLWIQPSDPAPFWQGSGMAIADLFNVLSSAAFFYLFLVLDKPSVKAAGQPERDRSFRHSLAVIATLCGTTAVLSALGRLELFGLNSLGPTMGSMLAAISMAFFFGRMSDSHLKVSRSWLAPLYFYVAIQMLWHLSVTDAPQGDPSHGLVLVAALGLKVYLYVLLTRWMSDYKLQTYFDEVAFPRLPADLE